MKKRNTNTTKVTSKKELLVFNKPEGPKTLEEIVGIGRNSDYEVSELEDYKEYISTLNLIEIQDHAISLGFRPSGDRVALIRLLINEFSKRKSSLANLVSGKTKTKKEGQEARTIHDLLKGKTKLTETTVSGPKTLADLIK